MKSSPSQHALRVFLVEDALAIRARMAARLGAIEGVEIVGEAEEPEAALTAIGASAADVVVLDLRLAGGTGLALLQRLAQRLQREIRVVIAGAAERTDDAESALTLCWERARTRWRDRVAALERRLSAQSPALRIAGRAQRLSAAAATLRSWPPRAQAQWRRALDVRLERTHALCERFMLDRTRAA